MVLMKVSHVFVLLHAMVWVMKVPKQTMYLSAIWSGGSLKDCRQSSRGSGKRLEIYRRQHGDLMMPDLLSLDRILSISHEYWLAFIISINRIPKIFNVDCPPQSRDSAAYRPRIKIHTSG